MIPNPIHRRSFLRTAGLSAVAVASLSSASFAKNDPKNHREVPPQNVILILTDQQHQDTIAAAGAKGIVTPGMDKLVKRGVTFTHSHATNPVCGPCRSSLFTGRATSETGVFKNGPGIRKGMPNIGEWLRETSDYETHYAGKWHLPRYYTDVVPGFTMVTTGLGGQGNLADPSTTAAVEAFLMTRARKTAKPFFLAVNYMQPHDICEWLRLNTKVPAADRYPEIVKEYPALPANHAPNPNEPVALIRRRTGGEASRGEWTAQQWRDYRWAYLRHGEMVGAQVDRLMNTLDATGLAENTVVILTSDHGEGCGEHKMVRKSSPYNASLKVPLVIAAPGGKSARNDADLVSSFDLVPTVCDVVGIASPPNQRGRSLMPALVGKPLADYLALVCEVDDDNCRVVRTRQYKLITYCDGVNDLLFDLDADPGETKNLAADAAHAKNLAAMKKHLIEWEAKLTVAPKLPNPDAWWRGGKRK